MATKSILLAVAEPQTQADLVLALGTDWLTTSAASEAEALAQLEQRAFEALLVDFNLGSSDASELLNHALEKHPAMVRLLLAHESDLALVAAKVKGSHQILPKPIQSASVKSRLENALQEAKPAQSDTPKAPVQPPAPPVPPVYSLVLAALEAPDVTFKQVGTLIARDAALKKEVLRLTKSGYKGLPRNVTDPVEAVESLGLEAVKALVLALRFLTEHSHLKPAYLSIDKVWQHSTNVAQLARDLVLHETKDRAVASQAFAAGLLHDLGKVVLVTNFDDLYGRVHSLARKQPVPIWDIEKEMFGANHGEIGACLLGMWNLPMPIVEAAAYHHEPPLGEHDKLDPLAAVHIANVLEYQLRPSDDYRVAPIISTPFLNELGLLQRLPVWRATAANQAGIESGKTGFETAQSSQTGNYLPEIESPTRTGTFRKFGQNGRKARSFGPTQWAYAGIAAGVLFLLALWLRTEQEYGDATSVYARSSASSESPTEAPANNSSGPGAELAPSVSAQHAPTASATASGAGRHVATGEPAPDSAGPTISPAVSKVEVPQRAPEPALQVASQPTATNAVPAGPPKEALPAELRLNGIFFTGRTPSALVNGKTVYVGDQIDGATVVSIGQNQVTLQSKGRRQTLFLR